MKTALAIAIAMTALAPSAHAATVSVFVPPCADEQSKYGQCYPDQARFTAETGERNTLTITAEAQAGTSPASVTFHDDSATITADKTCRQVDEHTATCTGYAIGAVVDAGDGDDTVSGPGEIQGGVGDDTLTGSQLEGGAGNDHLQGTDQTDVLIGGPGNDTIDGGPGNDTIVDNGTPGDRDVISGGDGTDLLAYDGRTAAVTVSLEQPASNEDELTGIENLRGGQGDDVLTGDAGPNTIDGGAGDDVLEGGDGDDVVTGGPGSDAVQGGPGNDKLGPGDDKVTNTIVCGSGVDRADPAPKTLLEPDCEIVGVDDFDLGGTLRLRLPFANLARPFLTWTAPNCLDRPCSLEGTVTGVAGPTKGKLLGQFTFLARKGKSKLPRRLNLRLNALGRSAVRKVGILGLVRIVLDDAGDRASQTFLVALERG
jgi:Ca2+-binding RTX toxin-like protein